MKTEVSISELKKLDDAFKRLGVQGQVKLGGKIIKLGLPQTFQSQSERAPAKKAGPKPKSKPTAKQPADPAKTELAITE